MSKQCPSLLRTKSGLVFCTKRAKHDGDHRGYRAQWNAAGERVPITEPDPTSSKGRSAAK